MALLSRVESFMKYDYTRKLYPSTAEDSMLCVAHCLALSVCDHAHAESCIDITYFFALHYQIALIMASVSSSVSSAELQEEIACELGVRIDMLFGFAAHLVQCFQQDLHATQYEDNLCPNSCILTVDYKQKVQSLRQRETQEEYFGKSGRSLLGHMWVYRNLTGELVREFDDATTDDGTQDSTLTTFLLPASMCRFEERRCETQCSR